jgi:hypothetical protein
MNTAGEDHYRFATTDEKDKTGLLTQINVDI